MSDLVVVIFDKPEEAREARETIHSIQKQYQLSLNDAAVITKDASGKVHVDNEVDYHVKVGAGVGALMGVLLFMFFPIGGIILGALGGGLIGRFAGDHVDKKFREDVINTMQPGSSALFLIIRNNSPAALRGALEPYQGKIFQTNVSEDLEKELESALK